MLQKKTVRLKECFLPQLFSECFIEWTTPNGLLKKMYYPYNKFDASNRSS